MDELTRDFQDLLVRLALQDPSFVLQYRDCLDAEYVQDPDRSTILRAVLDHYDRFGSSASKEALIQRLTDDHKIDDLEEILDNLYDSPVHDASFIRERMVDFARKRAALGSLTDIESLIERGDYREAEELFLRSVHIGSEAPKHEEYFDTAKKRIRSYKDGDDRDKIPTGVRFLDANMDGGLARGEQGIIMGDAKIGKTMVLVNLAKNAVLRGFRISYYTLEVSTKIILRRLDMSITGMTKQELRKKRKTAYERIREAASEAVEGRFVAYQYPAYSLTVPKLHAHLRLTQDRDGFFPDLLIVDYGDLMASERRYMEYRHELSAVFADLRSLAVDLNIAQWTATQINREGAKLGRDNEDVVDKTHIREDYSKVQTTDVLVSINQTLSERRRNLARLFIAANRDDEDGQTVKIILDKRRAQLRDIDFDLEEDNGS